jgi:hypothetical protein
LLGKGANNFYGLKVSKPGIDVYTAPDSDLIFNSSQNVFKIVQSGTVDIVTGAGEANDVTVTHNLGYAPVVIAYLQLTDGIITPIPQYVGSSYTWLTSNPVNVKFVYSATTPGATATWTIKYYFLQESAV